MNGFVCNLFKRFAFCCKLCALNIVTYDIFIYYLYFKSMPFVCTKNIADTPHIDAKDGFKRYLKGLIVLENLSKENGATKIIPKSSENKKIVNLLNLKEKSDELKNEIKKIQNISEDVSLTGKKVI